MKKIGKMDVKYFVSILKIMKKNMILINGKERPKKFLRKLLN